MRSFSMSPGFVPTVKQVLRCLTEEKARQIAATVLQMKAVSEIKAFLKSEVQLLSPDVVIFDTQ